MRRGRTLARAAGRLAGSGLGARQSCSQNRGLVLIDLDVGLIVSSLATGRLLGGLEMRTGKIIGQDNEQRSELAIELGRDTLDELFKLGDSEVLGQHPHCLDEGVGAHATVGRVLSRKDLERRSRGVANDLVLGPWVRRRIALAKQVEDGNPDMGLLSDTISDRDLLDRVGPGVFPLGEEGAEGISDLFGNQTIFDLNEVGGRGVLELVGTVLNINDRHLLAHQDHHDALNVTKGSLLPLFAAETRGWQKGQPHDDEEVLEAFVEAPIMKFGINGSLHLVIFGESAMVLFECHNPVLEDAV